MWETLGSSAGPAVATGVRRGPTPAPREPRVACREQWAETDRLQSREREDHIVFFKVIFVQDEDNGFEEASGGSRKKESEADR